MLTIHVTVNLNDIIDEIFIHNMGKVEDTTNEDLYEYEIVDVRTKKRRIEETIIHKRSDGYRPLLIEALLLLEEYE